MMQRRLAHRAALVALAFVAVTTWIAPAVHALNRTVVCRPQSFFTTLTTLCICEPCMRCHFRLFSFECAPLSPNDGIIGSADDKPFAQPSLDPEDWFLTKVEITASRGGVPRDDLLTWSDGNHVEIFTATNKFFSSVYYDVGNMTGPGQIFITGWEITNIPFLPKSEEWEDSRFQAMIGRALDRGVNVTTLVWANLFHPRQTSAIQAWMNAHENGTWLFDNRLPHLSSSHHQKTIVIASGDDRVVAYVGGIDLTQDRWDNRFHNVSKIRQEHGVALDYDGWIDASLRLTGPVVHDVAANFVNRWNEDRVPLSGVTPFANPEQYDKVHSIVLDQDPIASDRVAGNMSVQLTRTYSCQMSDGGYGFAPKGEISILEARIKAIRQAKNYVYVEDQYFVFVPGLLDALMEVLPRIQALVVVTQEHALGTAAAGYEVLLYRMLQPLVEQFPDKVFSYTPRAPLELYVHTKVVIVDDVFLSVGSSNWNQRSMSSDTETTANVVDRDVVAYTPDGIQVSKLARNFRVRKFSEFSGMPIETVSKMRFVDALLAMDAASTRADSGIVVTGLSVDRGIYFNSYMPGFEKSVDGDDVCG